MLLNEVLLIANAIKTENKKLLNESYKANIIRDLIKPLDQISSIDINQPHNYMYPMVRDYDDLRYNYNRVLKQSRSQVNPIKVAPYFNDPVKRKVLLGQSISKAYTGRIFSKRLNDILYHITGKYINIADIPNENISIINDISLSKKKPYKNCLLFWVDSDKKLRAITCDNKVIMLISPYSSIYNLPLVNKDFIGDYSEDECIKILKDYDEDRNSTEYTDFVNKAYKFLPKFQVLDTLLAIRKELECNAISINKLQEYFTEKYIDIQIYCVDPEGMEQYDITELMKSRQEYQRFLNEEKRFLYTLRDRYKAYVKEVRNKKAKSENEDICKDLLVVCLDILNDIYTEQVNVLTSGNSALESERYAITVYLYEVTDYVYSLVRKLYWESPNIFTLFFTRGKRSYDKKSVNLKNKNDLLLYITLSIQVYTDLLNKILELYKLSNELEKDGTKLNELQRSLQELAAAYNSLKNYTQQININNLYSLLKKESFTTLANKLQPLTKYVI